MASWLKFALMNAVMGFLVGALVFLIAIGEGYYVFMYAAPIAVFITGALLWRLIVGTRRKNAVWKVLLTGVLTGSVSHYVSWVIVGLVQTIDYWSSYSGQGPSWLKPMGLYDMVTSGSLVFSIFSLMFFGWITVPGSVMIGLYVRDRECYPPIERGIP